MITPEGFEGLMEDKELQHQVIPTFGKCDRESPSTSDESMSKQKLMTMGTHLNPPSHLTLTHSVTVLELVIEKQDKLGNQTTMGIYHFSLN